jgi:hypothetical protein
VKVFFVFWGTETFNAYLKSRCSVQKILSSACLQVGGFLFFGRSSVVEQLAEPQTAKVFSGT